MYVNPPLTDEEVCKKYDISQDDLYFPTARDLEDHRPDRVICAWPYFTCPSCLSESRFRLDDRPDVDFRMSKNDAIVCNACERLMYVEDIGRKKLTLTLCTHPHASEAASGVRCTRTEV